MKKFGISLLIVSILMCIISFCFLADFTLLPLIGICVGAIGVTIGSTILEKNAKTKKQQSKISKIIVNGEEVENLPAFIKDDISEMNNLPTENKEITYKTSSKMTINGEEVKEGDIPDHIEDILNEVNEAFANGIGSIVKKKHPDFIECQYCGASNEYKERKCISCGASLKHKK